MAYTLAAVVAGISLLVYYIQLPWILVPVLLFGVFLASGGKSFPRVFFRTVLRDLRYVRTNKLIEVKLSQNIEVKLIQKNSTFSTVRKAT